MTQRHKGKPSGKYAESKTDIGKKANRKRTGWPEEAPTQHVADATARQRNSPLEPEQFVRGEGNGRNRKAGGPD